MSHINHRSIWTSLAGLALASAAAPGCSLDWSDKGSQTLRDAEDASACGAQSDCAAIPPQMGDGSREGQTCTQASECDDGSWCNGKERCANGKCSNGEPPPVDDDTACTNDQCDELGQVVLHEPEHARCDDGRTCNGREMCDPTVGCIAGTPDVSTDDDRDGFSEALGDCDDCAPLTNPGAIEVEGNEIDDDCDHTIDVLGPLTCDDLLTKDSIEPLDAASAIELCTRTTQAGWGVLSASYVSPDGFAAPVSANFHSGHGILRSFGPNLAPRAGDSMLVLSSGRARAASDPDYTDPSEGFSKGYQTAFGVGMPTQTARCPQVALGQPTDGIAFEMQLVVPTNSDAIEFDVAFYTSDWPDLLCSKFNDQFAVVMEPATGGASDGEIILFGGVPLSVNTAPFTLCECAAGPPCTAGDRTISCSEGANGLAGTGFDTLTTGTGSHAATGWITTRAPVIPGSAITLRWLIYDSGDGLTDSTALIDNFRFIPMTSPRQP